MTSDLVKRLRARADEQERCNSYPVDRAMDREAADRIEALERERQWRPIESAPRDGTVFIGGAPGRASAETYWCGEWCNSPDYQPTNWLPLPQPPEGTDK